MKKLLSIILAGIMVLSLVACGGASKGENPDAAIEESVSPTGEKLSMTIDKSGSQTGEKYAADVYYEPADAITVEAPYENQQHIKNTENNTLIK